MRNLKALVLLLTLALVVPLVAIAQPPGPPPSGPAGGPSSLEQAAWASTFQGRLAILWLTELGGETVVIGKTFRPNAMHRVTIAVTGRKAPGGTKKQAKMMAFGNSGRENAIEQVLAANYPITVRATLRVPERLPRQGKPAILKQGLEPGSSLTVFCSLTPEELTKCVPSDDGFMALDRGHLRAARRGLGSPGRRGLRGSAGGVAGGRHPCSREQGRRVRARSLTGHQVSPAPLGHPRRASSAPAVTSVASLASSGTYDVSRRRPVRSPG